MDIVWKFLVNQSFFVLLTSIWRLIFVFGKGKEFFDGLLSGEIGGDLSMCRVMWGDQSFTRQRVRKWRFWWDCSSLQTSWMMDNPTSFRIIVNRYWRTNAPPDIWQSWTNYTQLHILIKIHLLNRANTSTLINFSKRLPTGWQIIHHLKLIQEERIFHSSTYPSIYKQIERMNRKKKNPKRKSLINCCEKCLYCPISFCHSHLSRSCLKLYIKWRKKKLKNWEKIETKRKSCLENFNIKDSVERRRWGN